MVGLEKMANFSLASSFEIVSQLEETFADINSVLWNGDSDGKVFYDIDKLWIGHKTQSYKAQDLITKF